MKMLKMTGDEDADRKMMRFGRGDEELAVVTVVKEGMEYGGHSHPDAEGILLISGQCKVVTSSEMKGMEEREVNAPCALVIEPGEEHSLIFSSGSIFLHCQPASARKS